MNTSKAKKLFPNVVVLKISLEDTYHVKAVFSNEVFKGGRYLVTIVEYEEIEKCIRTTIVVIL